MLGNEKTLRKPQLIIIIYFVNHKNMPNFDLWKKLGA
jgi:hypothetical protein